MSKLDTNHVVNLDLVKDRVNGVIKFGLADIETSDFFVGLYNNGSRVFDKDYIVTLYIVKPNGTFRNIKLEPKEGLKKYYCNLPDTLKNIPGEYVCQAMVFDNLTGEKKISKSKFKYFVSLDLASEMAGIIDEEEQESILTNILNRLLTLENPVEPYATQKHVDECVSTLTEEIETINVKDTEQDGKLSNIESKNTEQDGRLTSIEAKDVEQDGRLDSLENQIDGIDEKIVDTIEPSLDNYGNKLDALETKDIEHEQRMTNIESKNTEQDNRLTSIEGINATQNNRLDTLEAKDIAHESRLTNIETKNTEQDERLNDVETKNVEQDNRLDIAENRLNNIGNDITNTMQPIIDEHTSRLEAIEAIDVSQNTRLDAIEVKNQQQDDRLLDIEKVNKRQDMNLKCLFAELKNNMIDVTEEGNSIYLQNSTVGYTLIDEIKGNTLVNCNKEPDKEIILNGNINTQGYSNVTLTEGVDGGLVDVALEGNTMVNVCDQKDPVAITKSYTVETGNHVALQGEYDGKCRPVVTGNTLVNIASIKNKTFHWGDSELLQCPKSNTTYTFIVNITNPSGDSSYNMGIVDESREIWCCSIGNISSGYSIFTLTTNDLNPSNILRYGANKANITATFDIIILEGDYTNKPIPGYFTGLQSSFEDKVVTQEMIDAGEESAENLGKYKVDYVISREDGTVGQTKTFYLNSPLLEGDTIEQQGNNVVHVHRRKRMILSGNSSEEWVLDGSSDNYAGFFLITHNFDKRPKINKCISDKYATIDTSYWKILDREGCIANAGNLAFVVLNSKLSSISINSFKKYLQSNPIVAEYRLATPQYEVISQNDTILCDSYVNGHLDVDSAVPIEKIRFMDVILHLKYKYHNTEYNIQFESDNIGVVEFYFDAWSSYNNVVKGMNKFTLTSKPEGTTGIASYISFEGIGFNASNIVVTEATDQDFGYFEGMKSVGECEDLEVVSSNSDATLSNTQTLTHEPLRAVGDIKDKYVLIDGKWYIERNCAEVVFDGSDDENWILTSFNYPTKIFEIYLSTIISTGIMCDKMPSQGFNSTESNFLSIFSVPQSNRLRVQINYDNSDVFKQWLQSNPVTVIYQLATPTYEPIDYNPFTVYSDITHISNNSTIPANMVIKNTGYNCLLKPNTTYTVSSNLGLNTVTTPSTLTEDCLRFYDTDTSTVTTMNNVTILEGDYTTGKPLPSHFSGIESAFEQEYDEAVGKYKVKVRVQNEDASKENYIEFYINEPLRGIGDVKDKVYVKNDKVVVERNCGQRAYQDGDFGTYLTDKVNTVYPLAEPIYEEVEYNDVKLFIESFKNSTLFYNSNIPVTSKLWYSYSIPIVDTVAQTANVTDQQDSMIIDLATQCAVMEIMLM